MKVSLALGDWMVEVWDGQGQGLVLWIRLLVGEGTGVGPGPEVEALPLAPGEGLSGIQENPQVEVGCSGGPGGETAGSLTPGRVVEAGALPDSAAAAAA